MKKLCRWALALGLVLALLVCGALAAEETPIHVQLDGQELTFTDAVPQVKDQRTFLPFRAVFEAMGATVDYEGSVITAVRDDVKLTMTLDQTTATVSEDGVDSVITMDVAPYVDNATWRTYVPVRFAAQAFGCAVGWDQEAQTAIVIDVDKLLGQALEGKSFTYLEKLTALDGKYDEGIWDMTGKMDMDLSASGITLMDMDADVTGTTQGTDKMDMDMTVKMDMTTLVQMLGAMSGETAMTAEDQAMLDALKTQGIAMSMRGDMTTGKLYMNMDLTAMGEEVAAEIDPNVWYEMDMNELMAQSGVPGMDWSTLLEQSKGMDYMDLGKALLASGEVNSAVASYDELKGAAQGIAIFLSDESFSAEVDGSRVSTLTVEQPDAQFTLTLTLDMDGEAAKGYTLVMDGAATGESQNAAFSMSVSMDDQDKCTVGADISISGFAMGMNMDAAYTPGSTAPVVTPPEGATVTPYAELMGDSADMGVIGGADGPTQIVVPQ